MSPTNLHHRPGRPLQLAAFRWSGLLHPEPDRPSVCSPKQQTTWRTEIAIPWLSWVQKFRIRVLSETNQNIARLNSTKRQSTCGSDGATVAVDRLQVRRDGDSRWERASVSGVRNDGKSVTIANDNVKPAVVNRLGCADSDMLAPIRWSRHFRLLSSQIRF